MILCNDQKLVGWLIRCGKFFRRRLLILLLFVVVGKFKKHTRSGILILLLWFAFIHHAQKKGSNLISLVICVVSCHVFVFIKDMSVLLLEHLLYCLESCINHQCSVSFWSFVHTEACNKTSRASCLYDDSTELTFVDFGGFPSDFCAFVWIVIYFCFFNLSSVFWKRGLSLLSLLIESKGRQYFLFWIWVV